jgi:hypothetical protein
MHAAISAVIRISLVIAMIGCLSGPPAWGNDVYINPNYSITGPGGPALSPPHVYQTNECATRVYVDSIVPKATISVFLNGTTLIGGPIAPKQSFYAVPLTQALHTGDKITATQTVNGTTSAASEPMEVGDMPAMLTAPVVSSAVYACGRVVSVSGLTSGVHVEVRDNNLGMTIGNGSTPNDWGDDWAPVVTSSLTAGHDVSARQFACTGTASAFSATQAVKTDPSPVTVPTFDQPIVGNDTITVHDLLSGSKMRAFDYATAIGSAYSNSATNWMNVSPNIPPSALTLISVEQILCSASVLSPPQSSVSRLPPPKLVAPICPGAPAVTVRDTTIGATLVLLKNGVVVGYGGAAPGDVPLDIAPIASFAENDSVEVVEYIGSIVAPSNIVKVECHDVITYHNDSQRTGWNQNENTLNTANVNVNDFGLVAPPTDLDDLVDAQPLIVTNQAIEGKGVRAAVVYVATQNNSVYAIDAFSGAILKRVYLGKPVPRPLNCANNGPVVGINGTPTIDLKSKTLYVIDYVMIGSTPTHRVHALDLETLVDKARSPVKVEASNKLSDGSIYQFDASVQRQRAGLLLANGNVYAGFSSYCDRGERSRGWVLGWNASNLESLINSELLDKTVNTASTFDCYIYPPWTSNHPCFLSSVWMSGFGLAADAQDGIFFTTGNTAPGFYGSPANLAESVVKLSPDLAKVLDFFTPKNENDLDQIDEDYGSGGALVLPDQPGPKPHLVVAAGKDGELFIIDRDTGQMGGFHNPTLNPSVTIGECWCGPS